MKLFVLEHICMLLHYLFPQFQRLSALVSPFRLSSGYLLLHYRYKNLSDSLTLSLSLSGYDITLMDRPARNDPTNCVLKVLGVLTEVYTPFNSFLNGFVTVFDS